MYFLLKWIFQNIRWKSEAEDSMVVLENTNIYKFFFFFLLHDFYIELHYRGEGWVLSVISSP